MEDIALIMKNPLPRLCLGDNCDAIHRKYTLLRNNGNN